LLFFENFKRICEAKGTNVSATVQAIGMSKNAAGNWKKLGTVPKEATLIALAAHLDCKVSDFFKDETERSYHEELIAFERLRDQADDKLDEFEQYLIDLYGNLDTRDKTAFMQQVYDFADEHGVEL